MNIFLAIVFILWFCIHSLNIYLFFRQSNHQDKINNCQCDINKEVEIILAGFRKRIKKLEEKKRVD